MLVAKFLSQKEIKQIKIVISISRKFSLLSKVAPIMMSSSFLVIYMICWTPYTLLAIYTSFTQKDTTPIIETLSTVFAKSSVLFSPLFELYFNNTLRKKR
jgi:hypothetical protein